MYNENVKNTQKRKMDHMTEQEFREKIETYIKNHEYKLDISLQITPIEEKEGEFEILFDKYKLVHRNLSEKNVESTCNFYDFLAKEDFLITTFAKEFQKIDRDVFIVDTANWIEIFILGRFYNIRAAENQNVPGKIYLDVQHVNSGFLKEIEIPVQCMFQEEQVVPYFSEVIQYFKTQRLHYITRENNNNPLLKKVSFFGGLPFWLPVTFSKEDREKENEYLTELRTYFETNFPGITKIKRNKSGIIRTKNYIFRALKTTGELRIQPKKKL